jgi:hypothetical protein
LVSTLLSHQFPSLSAVSFSDVLSFTISRSFDGLDILIAVLTVERTSAIVLGCRISDLITVDKDQRGTCLFSGLLGGWSAQAVAALIGGTARSSLRIECSRHTIHKARQFPFQAIRHERIPLGYLLHDTGASTVAASG